MAKKRLSWIIPAGMMALTVWLIGCTTFQASGLQMDLVINGQRYEKVHHFSGKAWTNKFLGWGTNGGTLFNLSSDATEPKIRQVIEKNINHYGGDAAVDVHIKYGSNPIQWLLTAVTAGFWMPGTVTVSGTVVKAVN